MNLEQLMKRFPDDETCSQFFESIRWPSGRFCPHCGNQKHWVIQATENRPKRYECNKCQRQYTVTTRTALHSTKLPLRKWMQAMYLITSSSKGISSVILSRLIGTTQSTAWKMGHTIRKMMTASQIDASLLSGIVELDETYIGGTPKAQPGIRHKWGKGTSKQ